MFPRGKIEQDRQAGQAPLLEAATCVLHELHVHRHELGDEGLEVVDRLVPLLQPVLVEGSDLAELRLQLSIADLDRRRCCK